MRTSIAILRDRMLRFVLECGRALGMENYTIPDSSITSPGPHYFNRFARYARLNGRFSWCASALGQPYLQIDLGKTYKVTSIATQGGRMDTGGKWVEEYKVAFYAGAKHVMYSESGKEKVRKLRIYCKPHILIFSFLLILIYLLLVRLSRIKFLVHETLCRSFQVFFSGFQVCRRFFSFFFR